MQRSGSCLDLKELAAFTDGRLQGSRRERVIAHLNRCQACYEIFSDTAHFLQQDEGEEAEPAASPSRRQLRWIGWAAAVLLAALLIPALLDLTRGRPWEQPDLWLTEYGRTPPGTPLAARAGAVFDKVALTFGHGGAPAPRLEIINKSKAPFAQALPEGTIILTRGGLELCYQDVSPQEGDARLAYLLGHELDHLRHGEDFHAFAAYVLKDADPGSPLEVPGAGKEAANESRADRWGLIHAVMAGYDPRLILRQSESFFRQWALQPTSRAAYSGHPEPQERARLLLDSLREVADHLNEFYYGVRYYQLGIYQTAQPLLERFESRYPGREVLNNLGLIHFQRAARQLARLDGWLIIRFRFPLSLDTQTVAGRTRLRGDRPSGDLSSLAHQNRQFQDLISEALRVFEAASSQDPLYLPARLNIVSAYLLAGEYEEAFLEAMDAMEAHPGNLRAEWASLLATFADGWESGASGKELASQAIEEMRALHERFPQSPEIAYNLASMLTTSRRLQEAEPVWGAFLKLEPSGPFAAEAHFRLGEDPGEAQIASVARTIPVSPLELGPVSSRTRQVLRQMDSSPLEAGDGLTRTAYENARLRALERNAQLMMVEEKLITNLSRAEVLERHGPPLRRVSGRLGEFWGYSGFGFDFEGETASHLVYYHSELTGN
ncbi:MAG: tetratricopeptide repeat protein [Acidobacteriota bacterium]